MVEAWLVETGRPSRMVATSSARSAAALVTQRSRSVRYSVAMLAVKSRMYSKSSSEVRFISSARIGSGTSVAAASSRAAGHQRVAELDAAQDLVEADARGVRSRGRPRVPPR